MTNWSRTVAIAVAAIPLAIGVAGGCSGALEEAGTDDGGDVDAAPDGTRPKPSRGGAADARVDSSAGPPTGKTIPAGWSLFADYDPACGFYIPDDKAHLPEPYRWESCSVLEAGHGMPGPDSMDCRRMVTDWQAAEGPNLLVESAAEVVDGKARLEVTRIVGDIGYVVVADADGPVHNSLLLTGGCGIKPGSMNGGKAVYRIYDSDNDFTIGGAIGGSVDSLQPVVYLPKGHRSTSTFSQQFDIGARYLVEEVGSADPVYALDSMTQIATIAVAPEDFGMIYAGYRFSGDDVFWEGGTSIRSAVKVWTRAGGVKTLVGWPNDYTRSASGIGTDGVDMVWLEENGLISEGIYSDYQVWTAKYSTDPAAVATNKRHVLADTLGSYSERFVVGCGYAAIAIHPNTDWGQAYGVRVVRLADGVSWTVYNESAPQVSDLVIQRPLAVTCDEVFARGLSKRTDDELVRIRIDSLGPGIAPQ
ncbi:hypothetical protein AKJ09_02461 [Labilithrix luteola]|uniref:Uncharacterized protein n=1 Tax=Labilithrix luteola TaxID=1391654 RepID=A0A0K1PQJ9_9BACT|nr:hypothetical protein [Labilithrix luteola]AKU95797.1 hypothetical protein AKJ09_02461 [Labilithrix luteola]